MYNITVNSCVQHNRLSAFVLVIVLQIDIKESVLKSRDSGG